jgi:uncharacterized membrane protein
MGSLLGLSLVPLVGAAVAEIVNPLLIAGFMAAFRALDQGQDLEFPQLLAGFTTRPLPLAMIGALYLGAQLLIMKLMQMSGFDAAAIGAAMNKGDMQSVISLAQHGMPGLLLGVLLITPLLMATWMAPPLILFGNAEPMHSLSISLKACLRNWLPLTVYGLVLLPVIVVAGLIPFMLGLLVVGPILIGTLYSAYQDIFAVQRSQAAVNLA